MRVFHKNYLIYCILLILTLCITGCQKAPKRDKDTTDKVDLSSDKLVPVQEAKRQTLKLQGINMDGLQFPKMIMFPDVQEISEIKLTPWYTQNDNDLKKVIQSLWSDYDTVDWEKIQEQDFPNDNIPNYYGKEKSDKKTGKTYSYSSMGFFCGNSLGDEPEPSIDNCVKKYNFEWGEVASKQDKYALQDGELSVLDAVTYTEGLFNKHMRSFEKEKFTYKVQHLYVMKVPDQEYYSYSMVIGRLYNGMVVDTSSDFLLADGKSYPYTHCGNHIMATMCHKKTLDYVNTGFECFDIASTKAHKKIISPLWAVRKIKKEIAHIGGMSFQNCGLVYLLVQKNHEAKDNVQGVYQCVDDTTCLRPVWVFMTGASGSAFNTSTDDIHGASVIVDALDGTLYYYEETGEY